MQLAHFIDHTLLKPTATEAQIIRLCEEARMYDFAAVCVNGCWVHLCADLLADTTQKVAAVIGFPLGAMATEIKVAEAKNAMENGADEIDMVLNIGWLKDAQFTKVEADIRAVKNVIGSKVLKVILETGYLTDAEKEKACELAVAAKADYVKTSTGFGAGGATIEDVQLMKRVVGDEALIKASGGIRDQFTALKYIAEGVSRIGTSSGVAIVTE